MGSFKERGSYIPVPSEQTSIHSPEEIAFPESRPPHYNKRTWWEKLLIPLFLILFTLCIVETIIIFTHSTTSTSNRSAFVQPCGTSASEARERGCKFDLGLAKWVPPACYSAELDSAYLSSYAEPFDFFYALDSDHSKPDLSRRILTIEELSQTDGKPIYSTWQYHMTHCMHAMKYVHMAAQGIGNEDGGMLSESVCGMEHTKHCEGILLNRTVELTAVGEGLKVRFPDCVPLGQACDG